MGSNMAEAHPVAFQWVTEAKVGGTRVIHIDPRFTRTSAHANQHVRIRVGSDIAFLGGVVNYILSNDLHFKEYVQAYTNATFMVNENFRDTEDLDGLFSGYDPETGSYDSSSWAYETVEEGTDGRQGSTLISATPAQAKGGHEAPPGQPGTIATDPTMTHPRCVLQILKRHYARYTPEMVERVCGITQRQFLDVCRAWTENSGREKTTALIYSVGWTQHTVGAQYIRAGSIVQMLLGNLGRPGSGILALRGHASIQGSTDIPTLYNLLPGYMPMPNVTHHTLDKFVEDVRHVYRKGYWWNADAYMVSLLKEYWGDAATAENNFCYDYLPRIDGDHGTYQTTMDMIAGKVYGYFLMGQNPAVGSANGQLQRLGLANLEWLVVRDLAMIESATVWRDAPEIERGEISTEKCPTEVFFFPAASHVEKCGTFTQTQRMIQWRDVAVEPVDDRRSDLWFFYHLGRIVREKLQHSEDERDRPILDMAWDYEMEEGDEPSAADVLRHINGIDLKTGRTLDSYEYLKNDGSTACGCWIYTGVYADDTNLARRRNSRFEHPISEGEWAFVWPLNRRILYNRASSDPEGRPWSARKALVWWDEGKQEWIGGDKPDFQRHKPPDFRPAPDAHGPDALSGDDAFIMMGDGKAALYTPTGLVDGPLPTHYEPEESPVRNPLYGQQSNPTRTIYKKTFNPYNPSPPQPHEEVFPYVFTASRYTEHHTAGAMSRTLPYLSELQPGLTVEVSPELAAERGLHHMGWAHVITSRTAVEAKVVVTDRLAPLKLDGRTVHQMWMPIHWGNLGITTGDVTNDLIGVVLDSNVLIQESKVMTCDIQPGRRPRGRELLAYVEDYRRRAGVTLDTGTHELTVDYPEAETSSHPPDGRQPGGGRTATPGYGPEAT
ncbi:molybdopterin-dependent oxidoreductase [Streptomyces sp. DSM 110735]|nr:molybdopterin-dependent oxidoreductase [Streptomyces sp. DSM 110735]